MVRVINVAHWVILLFVLTAWMWPWPAAWWLHIVFVPLMIIHWRTNRNRCFLSQLEERFRLKETTENGPITRAITEVEVEESHFIRSVIKKFFGVSPTIAMVEWINYGVMSIAWLGSAIRLWARIF
jgi:hypothetical protein